MKSTDKKKAKKSLPKTPTHAVFAAVSGIDYIEDLPDHKYKLRWDNSYYMGDGVSVKPDGTFVDDHQPHTRD